MIAEKFMRRSFSTWGFGGVEKGVWRPAESPQSWRGCL
jgi:hypothetical protein